MGALAGAFVALHQRPEISWTSVLGFGVLSFAAAQFPISLPTGSLYDISFLITIAALLANGPATSVVATVFATVALREAFHRTPIRNLFNAAQLTLATSVGGVVYIHAGGLVGSTLIDRITQSPVSHGKPSVRNRKITPLLSPPCRSMLRPRLV